MCGKQKMWKFMKKKKLMRLSIVVRNRVKLVVEGKAERKETDNNIACFNNNLKTKLNWVIRNTTRRSKCRWTRAVLSSSLKRADCRSWGWILSHVTFRQSFAQLSSPISEGGAKGELERVNSSIWSYNSCNKTELKAATNKAFQS